MYSASSPNARMYDKANALFRACVLTDYYREVGALGAGLLLPTSARSYVCASTWTACDIDFL
mgnify:CR=1 FL=1